MYPKDMKSLYQRDACTTIFIATLFIPTEYEINPCVCHHMHGLKKVEYVHGGIL